VTGAIVFSCLVNVVFMSTSKKHHSRHLVNLFSRPLPAANVLSDRPVGQTFNLKTEVGSLKLPCRNLARSWADGYLDCGGKAERRRRFPTRQSIDSQFAKQRPPSGFGQRHHLIRA